MAKIIIREILISILIFVAIALTLAIILYGYNPSQKIVPAKVEYSTPENIKEEIASSTDSEELSPIIITYELDEAQINSLKKAGSYTTGKQNPFARQSGEDKENSDDNEDGTEDDTDTDTGEENDNTNDNDTSSGKTSSGNKNEVNYLPKTGTK